MKNYEFMIIINPELWDEEKEHLILEIKEEINWHDLEIKEEDIWGIKEFAYKIKWSDKWYYLIYKVQWLWKKNFELSKELNLKKNVWRYMLTNLSDK